LLSIAFDTTLTTRTAVGCAGAALAGTMPDKSSYRGARFLRRFFFAGSQVSRIEHASETEPVNAIDVGFDGYLFPRSGVAFVWVLKDELISG
jgi:hypothetical protein